MYFDRAFCMYFGRESVHIEAASKQAIACMHDEKLLALSKNKCVKKETRLPAARSQPGLSGVPSEFHMTCSELLMQTGHNEGQLKCSQRF